MSAWFDNNAATADPGVLREAFKSMTWRMGQNDAEWDNSAAVVKRGAAAGLLDRGEFESFTRNFAMSNPGKCLELLAEVSNASPPLAAQTDSVIAGIVDRSSTATLNTLGSWLNSHKDFPLYDQAAGRFALRTNADDPAAAGQWAASIKDETLRVKTQEELKNH
jgi:hypothetical protein